jgi:hypothetical protein
MRLSHDLSHDSWHRIENRHRDIYEYNLQDVSQSITKAEIENEILLKKKVRCKSCDSHVTPATSYTPAEQRN